MRCLASFRTIRRSTKTRPSPGMTGNMATKVATPLVVVSAIVVVLSVTAASLWRAKWGTYHFATVDPGKLYRDGNRGQREFCHALERGGIRTVVDLVDDSELSDTSKPELGAEAGWCSARGVRVERIPVKLGGWPTSDDVKKFLAIVTDKQNQPVLVHCAQGVRRTGMMVAAYQ